MKAREIFKKHNPDLIYIPILNRFILKCQYSYHMFSKLMYIGEIKEKELDRWVSKFITQAVFLKEGKTFLCRALIEYLNKIASLDRQITTSRATIAEYAHDDRRLIFEIEWELKYLKNLYEKRFQAEKNFNELVNYILNSGLEIVDYSNIDNDPEKLMEAIKQMKQEGQ